MKCLSLIFSSLLAFQSIAIASTCEINYRIVDECYETRGRLQAANGYPSVQIWKVGTKRILGVKNENLENLPSKVKETFSFGVFVSANYKVCPLTKEKPGRMQMVCVESMKNIRIEDYRENPDVPVITIIENQTEPTQPIGRNETGQTHAIGQNETEQMHSMVQLVPAIIIFAVILMFFYFYRTKGKVQKSLKPFEHKSDYQKIGINNQKKKTILSKQQNNVQTANNTKAKSEAAKKEQGKNYY